MRIGLDFDNTLVRYDKAFFIAAKERGLIDESVPMTKRGVRKHLQDKDQNDLWTEIQGYVYGPGMSHADFFPDVLDFMIQGTRKEWKLFIVSHRTQFPYKGPSYDLHQSARDWLANKDLEKLGGLSNQDIYFETSKEKKLQRAKELQLDVFIDDLPDILMHDLFPQRTKQVLFDPSDEQSTFVHARMTHWRQAVDLIANS